MSPDDARARFAAARVARLATLGPTGPHLVPICFASEGDVIWSAVDAKPKRARFMKRLRNIAADPRVTLLADEYRDDAWEALWWARADGTAEILDESAHARTLLCDRYPQYQAEPPAGPFLRITVARWSGWAYAG